jgi:hypothetical protein
MHRWRAPNRAISIDRVRIDVVVEPLRAVIASVRGLGPHTEADAVVDQDPCVSAEG